MTDSMLKRFLKGGRARAVDYRGEQDLSPSDRIASTGSTRSVKKVLLQVSDGDAGAGSSAASSRLKKSRARSSQKSNSSHRQSDQGREGSPSVNRLDDAAREAFDSKVQARDCVVWRHMMWKHCAPKAAFSAVLHPHLAIVYQWDLLIIALLVAQAVVLPLQLAFISDSELPKHPWLFWFTCWCELTLWLDLALQFFLQIQPEDRTYWITDLRTIVYSYLRGEFMVDLLSVLPIKGVAAGLAATILDTSVSAQRENPFVVLIGFHKLLRFHRGKRTFNNLETNGHLLSALLQFTYAERRLFQAFLHICFTVHVIGCLWAALAVCGSENNSWYSFYASLHGDKGLYSKDSMESIYMCALYWAVFTLTGIGYGDIVPIAPLEYGLAIACMFAGSLTWAWVVANIVSVKATMNKSTNEHLHTLDYVTHMLHEGVLPSNIGPEVRQYFTRLLEVKAVDFEHQTVHELSPELSVEIVNAIHGPWISQIWWLQGVPARSEFVVDFTQHLKATLHAPNETIPARQEFNVVRQGLCIHGGRMLKGGDIFGEDMLLNNEALRKRHITYVLTYLHVLQIDRHVFDGVVSRHPDAQPCIRKAFLCLALMRGMVYHANLLRTSQKRNIPMWNLLHTKMPTIEPDFDHYRTVTLLDMGAAGHHHHHHNYGAGEGHRWSEEDSQRRAHLSRVQSEGLVLRGRVCDMESSLRFRMTALESKADELLKKAKLLKSMQP